jgi:hypothetical protein
MKKADHCYRHHNGQLGEYPNRSPANAFDEPEALIFAAAARRWLDHTLGGDVPVSEGIAAAQIFLQRARSFAEAA